MFDRVKFKTNAKAQLKGRFKIPLLASLTIALINLVLSITSTLLQDTEFAATAFSVFQIIATAILNYSFVFLCLKVAKTNTELSYSDFTDGFAGSFCRSILGITCRSYDLCNWRRFT